MSDRHESGFDRLAAILSSFSEEKEAKRLLFILLRKFGEGMVMVSGDDSEGNWQDYWNIPDFEEIYLEDSYVLAIRRDEGTIFFEMEFTLRENHDKYHPPFPGEQYCYRRWEVMFRNIAEIVTFLQTDVVFHDANNEDDRGNIDNFVWQGKRYRLEGDWGFLDILCDVPIVSFA